MTTVAINPRRMRKYGITQAWLDLMQIVNPAAAARALHALAPVQQRTNPGHARHWRKRLGVSARQYKKMIRGVSYA